MLSKFTGHVVKEWVFENIYGRRSSQVKKAQKSLFAWSFKCYQEDEYDGIATAVDETNGQAPPEPPIYACKFGEGPQYGHILVLANEDGKIGLRDTRQKGNQAAIEAHQIHNNAIFDVCWVPGTPELVSVSGDQTAIVLRVKEDGALEPVLTLMGHSRSVKTVHVNPFDPYVIATGARDGSVIIWDKRCKPHHRADEIAPAHHSLTNRSIASPSMRKVATGGSLANNSVTGVVFQQQHTLISSGASDGLIKLWDLRKTHSGGRREPQCQSLLEHSGNSSHRGFTSLSVSPERDVLYTSCMDNVIYAYHLANPTPKPVAEYRGHVNLTYYVKSCLSPCGSYLLSGSSDNHAYIWLTEKPGRPIARLTGHFAEVTSVGWCPVDDEKLVTCADDMKLRVFQRRNTNLEDFDERMKLRGLAEVYTVEHAKSDIAEPSESSGNEPQDPLPPLPITPSTSRLHASTSATPSSMRGREGPSSMQSPQSHPMTPRQQTPHHRSRGRGTPCTPKTSERNTLLHWLAVTKTPGPQESPSTSGAAPVSASKKAGLKRKLTDLMGEDQENISGEDKKKSPNSPKKNVLCPSSAQNFPCSPQPSVAKMLKYGDDARAHVSLKQEGGEGFTEMSESIKPIEAQDKVALDGGFRKPVTNIVNHSLENVKEESTSCPGEQLAKAPKMAENAVKNKSHFSPSAFRFRHLSSPTANLPNYVVDGSSPHNRPEVRVEKKKNTDWLTSFSHQRKLKFTRTPDKVERKHASGFSSHVKKKEKKVLHIKQKYQKLNL
ncbi:denticleless protein homolog [Penaeus vannamei]|uniref:denticleless protein homolog n=1 Tax=Penaeus vannamei TaxID=6689 RepID=UPI00387F9540